jgi:hypothetical protein
MPFLVRLDLKFVALFFTLFSSRSFSFLLAMGHRYAATVDRSVPVVAELAECVVQHSWKTWAMLAC